MNHYSVLSDLKGHANNLLQEVPGLLKPPHTTQRNDHPNYSIHIEIYI